MLWEFLGKNTSESASGKKGGDEEVKLDFGLSSGMLPADMQKKWPHEFGLVYSVTLGKGTLETGLHVQNKGGEAFEFQCLFHNYLKIEVGTLLVNVAYSMADEDTRYRTYPKSLSTASNRPPSSTKSHPPKTHPRPNP